MSGSSPFEWYSWGVCSGIQIWVPAVSRNGRSSATGRRRWQRKFIWGSHLTRVISCSQTVIRKRVKARPCSLACSVDEMYRTFMITPRSLQENTAGLIGIFCWHLYFDYSDCSNRRRCHVRLPLFPSPAGIWAIQSMSIISQRQRPLLSTYTIRSQYWRCPWKWRRHQIMMTYAPRSRKSMKWIIIFSGE